MTKRTLTLAVALVAVALVASPAFAAGTVTGASGASGNGPIVTLTVPARVGVAWDRDVTFDLTTNAHPGSCLTYPPAPTTTFPCYWDDNTVGAMNVQLFANNSTGGATVSAKIKGAAGAFTGSNADITKVLYAAGGTATCAAGTAAALCAGYTAMSSAAGTTFGSVAAPTTGWATVTSGFRFIFEVDNNLTTTTGSPTNQTTLTVTIP
jgi:hypothetical protein